MKCFFRDSLEWLYPDTLHELSGRRACVLYAARGGMASVNVVMTACAGDEVKIASDAVLDIFRYHPVHVDRNTGSVGFCERDGNVNPFVTRRAPFDVFDAMERVSGESSVPVGGDAAFALRLRAGNSLEPGAHTVNVSVSCGGSVFDLEIRLNVSKARIPRTGRESWPFTNWLNMKNMADYHSLKPWSAGHFKMLEKYLRIAVESRQNTAWLPLSFFAEYSNGKYVFDRARFRKLVRLYTECGIYYIEGPHFASRMNGEWGAPVFATTLGGHDVSTPEGERDIFAVADFLRGEIKALDLGDRYIQHLADEPTETNAQSYRVLASIVRKYMPGVRIIDATMAVSHLAGALDIWCPQVQEYEKHIAEFAEPRSRGDSIWTYTCCFPGGKYLNRLLDGELVKPFLIPWACALYGLDGFLHWGLNMYRGDAFSDCAPDHGNGNNLPPGDTHIVYPAGDSVWTSARFEAMRSGLEDRELLARLMKKSPYDTLKNIRSIVRSFDDWTGDTGKISAARKRLYESADKLL